MPVLRRTSSLLLLFAGGLTAIIAVADWRIEGTLPLGFLYLFPMLLAGRVLNRWQITLSALVCTFLTGNFDNNNWLSLEGIPRDILVFAAFLGIGLLVCEATRKSTAEKLHVEEIEREVHARREAEEQLKILIETSPAAVFTAQTDGTILIANDTAHRMFGVAPGALAGRRIHEFLPSLLNLASPGKERAPFRTAMQCRGHRANGEVFLADIWFSTYRTSLGSRLAGMVVDGSEDLRNREELSLNQLLASSRILVGAVSHEIRNLCGAAAMAHANLSRKGNLEGNKDFEALGNLIGALENIASMELRNTTARDTSTDLSSLLEELRIIAEPMLEEQGVTLHWEAAGEFPPVWADRQSVMQTFLNLLRNAVRAMEQSPRRELTVLAGVQGNRVAIRVQDSGCGVAHPERLFRALDGQSQDTGLGLYLSRAMLRSFRADLRYEAAPEGSAFVVELSVVNSTARTLESETNERTDPDSAGGRPRPLSRESEPSARIRV